jgi:sigma-B regulation protein RsbU (phosphoserine phosphatase)
MESNPPTRPERHEYEGDYRPANSENPHAHLDPTNVRIETADLTYLAQMADALNTTLDLETLLNRTSELVRAVIHYRIFAIFLLNEPTTFACGFRSATLRRCSACAFPWAKAWSGR